jgi:hypothetical protein
MSHHHAHNFVIDHRLLDFAPPEPFIQRLLIRRVKIEHVNAELVTSLDAIIDKTLTNASASKACGNKNFAKPMLFVRVIRKLKKLNARCPEKLVGVR